MKYYAEKSINFEKDINLLILNTADIIVTNQVITTGEIIINNDPKFTDNFIISRKSMYFDFKYFRKNLEDNLIMNDIILSKISNIKNCLKRIKDRTKLIPESLNNNFDTQDIFVLNLQRVIQATFDIANSLIKEYNLELPVNYKSGFEILAKHNFIDENIKEKMMKMAGFRNIAVHNYETINVEILKSILKNNLQDFENFYIQIIENE